MVRAKNKKSQLKKQQAAGVKNHGKKADIAQSRSQLDAFNLKIIEVTADGNCFFRSLADQLEGNEEEHKKYRSMVVQYMRNHRADFEPFIEDDVPFDKYCQSMEKDGTWAGHMELQAASLVTRRNICIHRIMSPRWYIRNFSGHEATMIHLSYHDGEHYNSVRLKEDSCEGPAQLILIKEDAIISAMENNKKAVNESKGSSRRSFNDTGSFRLVMAGTGCSNVNKIEQVLQEVDGDVDAAIEFLIAEQDTMDSNSDDDISCERDGDNRNGRYEEPLVASRDMITELNASSNIIQSVTSGSSQEDEKKLAKNHECSCGTKKKCRTCGSAVGKSSAGPVSTGKKKGAATKSRKETKQSRKKAAVREVAEQRSGNLLDLGALCI